MFKIFRFLHSYLCWIAAFLIIIILGFLIIGTISHLSRNRKKIYHWGTQVWAKSLLALGNVKMKVNGLENINKEGNYIFASNHTSSLDILVIAAVLPKSFLFVMREDLFKIPLLGKICKNAGYISLNVKNPQKSYQDIQNIISLVKEGESIMYYPEGGRKKELQEFKAGIAKIALESHVPIIPIAISGSGKLMPRKSLIFYSGIIKVDIGEAMHFNKYSTHQEVIQKIHDNIANRLREVL